MANTSVFFAEKFFVAFAKATLIFAAHCENMPIQIYRKVYLQKQKIFR